MQIIGGGIIESTALQDVSEILAGQQNACLPVDVDRDGGKHIDTSCTALRLVARTVAVLVFCESK